MRNDLQEIRWVPNLENNELEANWNFFCDKYTCSEDKTIPVGSTIGKFSSKCKWMTRYALNAINKKNQAWKKYRKKRSARNWDLYCNARNLSVDKVRQAKRNFEISLAHEVGQGNTSVFYGYARSKTIIKEKV